MLHYLIAKMHYWTLSSLIILSLIYVCYSDSKVSFVKDQTLNVVFPPKSVPTIQGLPDGHLRPLGWQKKPDGRVREEKEGLDTHAFFVRYVKAARPVSLRQMLKGESVIPSWEEDEYLRDRYGNLNLTITEKRERAGTTHPRRMAFRKFLADYEFENWYLANTVPEEMTYELPLPPVLRCGSYKERLVEAELWMSSGGTESLLHSHDSNNLHCVLHGRKDFILIENQHKAAFDFQETYPNSGAGYSPLDMNRINMFRYPKIGKTPWVWTTLMSGDCIYLPAGQLHQVRSYGRSLSYTVQFSPSTEFDSSDCNEVPPEEDTKKGRRKKKKQAKEKKSEKADQKEETSKKDTKLSDVNFVWTYRDGSKRLTDSNLKPDTLKRILLLLLRDQEHLHFQQFKHFYSQVMHEKEADSQAKQAFGILTGDEIKLQISRDEMTSLSKSQLKRLCTILNKAAVVRHDEL